MSKLVRILKSDDNESRQRQATRLKNEIVYLTEELQCIEITLDDSPKAKTKA